MRERGYLVWLVLIAVLVILFNLPRGPSRRIKSFFREGLAPLQESVKVAGRRMSETVQAVRDIGELGEQYRALSAELVALRNENVTLKALEKENIQLREQLRYRKRSDRNLVPCEVIARDMTGWWVSLRLGKGFLDGLSKDLAVITPDGLIGRTMEVTPRTTDVLLISDPSCRVSVEIARTGTFGIMSGQGRHPRGQGLCRVDFLNKNAEIREGDEVVTSGLGGVFPKGLLVGAVQRVENDPGGLSKRAHILTNARLGGLTHVFVVQETPDPVESLLIRRAQEARERP